MDNPVSGGLLADALLHEGLFAAKQLHGQLVVRRLEERLQLVADKRRLRLAAHVGRTRTRSGLFFRRSVEAHVVAARRTAKVNASTGCRAQSSGRTSAASAATTGIVRLFDKVHLGGDVVGNDEDVVVVVVDLGVVVARHKRIGTGPPVSARPIQRMKAAGTRLNKGRPPLMRPATSASVEAPVAGVMVRVAS